LIEFVVEGVGGHEGVKIAFDAVAVWGGSDFTFEEVSVILVVGGHSCIPAL
jgi:hypothetical protein